MAASEYKALTHVNLPFLDGDGRFYRAGSMIPHDAFVESLRMAEEAINDPDTEIPDVDEMIASMIEFGSLSEDADAELHPDHRPVEPGAPTMAGIVEQAKFLVDQMNERGEEIPAELQTLADSRELKNGADAGSGGDTVA